MTYFNTIEMCNVPHFNGVIPIIGLAQGRYYNINSK